MDALKLMVRHWAWPTEVYLELHVVMKIVFHLVDQMDELLARQMESNLVPHLVLCKVSKMAKHSVKRMDQKMKLVRKMESNLARYMDKDWKHWKVQ